MARVFTRLLVWALLLFAVALGAAAWWLHQPIRLNLPAGSVVLDLEIEPGTRATQVAEAVAGSGADVNVTLLQLWFRVSGQSRQSSDTSGPVVSWPCGESLVERSEPRSVREVVGEPQGPPTLGPPMG